MDFGLEEEHLQLKDYSTNCPCFSTFESVSPMCSTSYFLDPFLHFTLSAGECRNGCAGGHCEKS